MKELTALGHSVKCFDENVRIGGVYTSSYDRTMLTTSSLLTAYSDYSDGREDKPKFWSDEEYLAYLDGFANEFSLYQHINFRSTARPPGGLVSDTSRRRRGRDLKSPRTRVAAPPRPRRG